MLIKTTAGIYPTVILIKKYSPGCLEFAPRSQSFACGAMLLPAVKEHMVWLLVTDDLIIWGNLTFIVY